MARVVYDGVYKRFPDGTEAIKDLNLEIDDGEFVILVGPSGCGKSTALRMCAGLEEISEGELIIGDKVVNNLTPKERDIAMVFQSYALYPHMSVAENMGFALKLAKMPSDEINKRVNEAADTLDLTEYLHRKPKALSGGQRQRVAMGRAIVRQPQAFLMDEPLSNLDAKLRVSTRAQIKNLSHELKVTTIYVTHDQIEAMTLADRVVVMERGVVQQVGTPTEIYDRPANAFVAGFIGNPAMNLMEGKLTGGVFEGKNARISGLAGPDGQVTLGFRAEDAAVTDTEGEIVAPAYTMELLGDATMITVRAGGTLVAVKAAKEFRIEIGDTVRIGVPSSACHLFDPETGERIGE